MSDLRMQEALTPKERLVQAEDALRESEERFRSIWEHAIDAMVLSDAEGNVLMTNAAYHQLYGYPPEEVIGKSFAIIFPEEQRAWAVEEYRKLFHTPEILPAFESAIRRKDGTERLVEARYHFTFRAGQRTGLVSIVRDITEQKKAQEALQRSQRRAQRLMESNIIGIVIVEGDTILEASDAFLEMVKYTRADLDLRTITWAALTPPDYVPLNQRGRHGSIEGGAIPPFETEFSRKDGIHVPILMGGVTLQEEPQQWVCFLLDMTERKRTEEALLASEERLRLALEAGNIGVWDWNVQQNSLTWSERVYELHGVAQETFAVTVENFLTLIHPEDKPGVQEAIEQALQEHAPFHLNFRLDTPPEPPRWLTTSARVIYNAAGTPIRMLGATSDITELKELEKRKDEFISMASHELKTPITSLQGFTQLLKRKLEKQGLAEAVAMLEKMERQLARLTKLVSDLLDVSKIQTGQLDYARETIDIDALVHGIADTMQHISPTHTFAIHGASHKHLVGDSDRLEQVFINLLSNAVKYSPQASHVDIFLAATRDTVTVSVRDYGIGIPKQYQQKIFERFYRVSDHHDKTFPGLGMGLYISCEIIKRHGGRIWVESEERNGTTFFLSFPAASSFFSSSH